MSILCAVTTDFLFISANVWI